MRIGHRAQTHRCGECKEKQETAEIDTVRQALDALPLQETNEELKAKVSTLEEEVQRLNRLLKQERDARKAYGRLHEGAEAVHRMLASEPNAQQRATTLLGDLLHETGHVSENAPTQTKTQSLLKDNSGEAGAECRDKSEASTFATGFFATLALEQLRSANDQSGAEAMSAILEAMKSSSNNGSSKVHKSLPTAAS